MSRVIILYSFAGPRLGCARCSLPLNMAGRCMCWKDVAGDSQGDSGEHP
jgi:hypothetical protein